VGSNPTFGIKKTPGKSLGFFAADQFIPNRTLG